MPCSQNISHLLRKRSILRIPRPPSFARVYTYTMRVAINFNENALLRLFIIFFFFCLYARKKVPIDQSKPALNVCLNINIHDSRNLTDDGQCTQRGKSSRPSRRSVILKLDTEHQYSTHTYSALEWGGGRRRRAELVYYKKKLGPFTTISKKKNLQVHLQLVFKKNFIEFVMK